MESGLLLSMSNRGVELGTIRAENESLTELLGDEVIAETDPQYEQFLADVWVGIVLTFMVLSCICCMCSCLLYHKFQQWKRHIIQSRNSATVENGNYESESLPSYTVVSGLPSYEEALEQLQKVKEKLKTENAVVVETNPQPCSTHLLGSPMTRLSVTELFQLYKGNQSPDVVPSKT